MPATAEGPVIRIGVSACLLGQAVRYDGGHRRNAFVSEALARHFELLPICPEAAIGLGIPRPPIRLLGPPERARAVGVRDPAHDVTAALQGYARQVSAQGPQIAGYVFKKGSPSCGMERVRLYGQGAVSRAGRGIYAGMLMALNPLLPCEEEGRLTDPALRESFIERVYVYHDWLALQAEGLTPGRLMRFHSRHKFTLLAHHEPSYRALGRLLGQMRAERIAQVGAEYIQRLMDGLQHPAGRKRHSNVLLHLLGFLKRDLSAADKAELLARIEAYRLGHVPLLVPLTLLAHHLHHHPDAYLARQSYLRDYPPELQLRSML